MSSDSSVPTVEVALGPGIRALQWLLVLHVAAVLLVFAAALPKAVALLLTMAFLVSWLWLRRHPAFGHGPRALVRLAARGDGSWQLTTATRDPITARLLDGSVVWPSLLVLGFADDRGRARHRVLLGDELPPDALRRLRARLLNPPSIAMPAGNP